MYDCAIPNPDKNSTKMNSSHENDLADEALIVPATISSRMAPAAKVVAVKSIPALVVLVYQYRSSRTTMGMPRIKSLMVS